VLSVRPSVHPQNTVARPSIPASPACRPGPLRVFGPVRSAAVAAPIAWRWGCGGRGVWSVRSSPRGPGVFAPGALQNLPDFWGKFRRSLADSNMRRHNLPDFCGKFRRIFADSAMRRRTKKSEKRRDRAACTLGSAGDPCHSTVATLIQARFRCRLEYSAAILIRTPRFGREIGFGCQRSLALKSPCRAPRFSVDSETRL
jgi:hypothetical protein